MNISKQITGIVFLGLIFANIYIFLHGITLSEEIKHYESELSTLRVENIELENNVNEITSLNHMASVAAQLNFTQQSSPVYIKNLPIAFKQ